MTKQKDETGEVQPTEVKPRSGKRRSYPIVYKRRILTLVDQCTEPGEIGRRRDGLCSSHLTDWRRQQVHGVFDRAEPPVRGPKPRVLDDKHQRIKQRIEPLATPCSPLPSTATPNASVRGLPTAPALPDVVWIKPPSPDPQLLGHDQKESLQ